MRLELSYGHAAQVAITLFNITESSFRRNDG